VTTDKWATSKSTQLSINIWVKLLLLLENALNLNFEALSLTENLNPLRAHTHSDPIINKHTNRLKDQLWIYHAMH